MPVTSLRVRGLLLAAELLAGALRHVLPLLGHVVLLRLAGAGVLRRAAVVLPGLGDAVALLLFAGLRGGVGPGGGTDGDQACECALEELAAGRGIHGVLREVQFLTRKRWEAWCRNFSCGAKVG